MWLTLNDMLSIGTCYLKGASYFISLSFCSFSYNGICYNRLKLSVSDIIVSQKGSNEDGKLHFFGTIIDASKNWNLAPQAIKNSSSISMAKKEIKKFVITLPI